MGSLPPYVERPPHPDQNPERTQNRISSVSVHVSTLFKQSLLTPSSFYHRDKRLQPESSTAVLLNGHKEEQCSCNSFKRS